MEFVKKCGYRYKFVWTEILLDLYDVPRAYYVVYLLLRLHDLETAIITAGSTCVLQDITHFVFSHKTY